MARSLMRDPVVRVGDEPVSALDVTIQAQVVDLLVDIQDRLGVSILFISHDLSVVRNLAHRVLVMYRGACVAPGDTEHIYDRPHPPHPQRPLDTRHPLPPAAPARLARAGRSATPPLPMEPPPPP